MLRARMFLTLLAMPLAAQVTGTWYLVTEPDLRQRMDQATVDLKPGERTRVRAALARHNQIRKEIVIGQGGGWITLRFDGEPPLRLRADGYAKPWRGVDGRNYLMSARMEGADLVHTLMGEDGMRKAVFHAKGGELAVKVTVKAMLLAEPFEYALAYRR